MQNYIASDIADIVIEPTPDAYKHMRPLDYSILSSINTCPRYAIITYKHNLVMQAGRSQALAAGDACHQAFAAMRLIDLHRRGLYELFDLHGQRLFPKLWADMRTFIDDSELAFILQALYTSGFEDAPYDKKRTITNLEESLIAYYQHWRWDDWPVYIFQDGTNRVGIELFFDNLYTFTFFDETKLRIRYCGRIDGIHQHKDGSIRPHENKTASSTNDNWRLGIKMSHQTMGYCIGTQLELDLADEERVDDIVIHGLQIPLPKSVIDGLAYLPITRTEENFKDFISWMLSSAQQYINYTIETAPMHTHSCNRYFSMCPLVPYCDAPTDEKVDILNEMEHVVWNPLREEEDEDNVNNT